MVMHNLGSEEKMLGDLDDESYSSGAELNELHPHDVQSSGDPEDLWETIGANGIDLLQEPKLRSPELQKRFKQEAESGEDIDLDLAPGALDKTDDPVRIYMREMVTGPLLTREGEVEIAKRIERGELRMQKAVSRSSIGIREILAIGEDLKCGARSVKDVVSFSEEDLTDDILLARLKEIIVKIDALNKPGSSADSHGTGNSSKIF